MSSRRRGKDKGNFMRNLITLCLFIFCSTALPAFAADPVGEGLGKEPIHVRSDRLEAEGGLNKVSFSGDVVARHGDVTIYAQDLVLYYQDQRREVDRVEATGDVRIVQGSRVATAGKAIYFETEGRIVLTGSPRVHQGQSFIEGEEIVFLVNEEKSFIKSDQGSRVNAVFQPEGDKE